LGESIRQMFFDPSVESWLTASDYADEASARAALDAQEIGVAVIIPKSFTEGYFASQGDATVIILQDPTLSIGPTVVRDMVASLLDGVAGGGVAYRVIQERAAAAGQELDAAGLPGLFARYASWYADFQRAMFHTPEKAALVAVAPASEDKAGDPIQSMLGMILAGQIIFFSFFTGAYAMQSILEEAEEGTLPRLFTTPTNRTAILSGKFLGVFLMVVIQAVVLLVLGRVIFNIRWGSPLAVGMTVVGQMIAVVGLAVLLVSFIKTTRQAGPIFGGALTALGAISGLFTTNIAMPPAFVALGYFTPQGWALRAWRLTLGGQPAIDLLLPFIVMTALGLVMFVIGANQFRRRFA
jgi:ABC-2 type transport system permease protein